MLNEALAPELLGLLSLAIIVIAIILITVYHRMVVPLIEGSEFLNRYRLVIETLDQVASNTAMRIAFNHEDLTRFEKAAQATGRDVRLVAAMHLVNRYTEEHGIQLDEEYIVSTIEARLADLKERGIIPRGGVQPGQ